jgi:hypothetical protein
MNLKQLLISELERAFQVKDLVVFKNLPVLRVTIKTIALADSDDLILFGKLNDQLNKHIQGLKEKGLKLKASFILVPGLDKEIHFVFTTDNPELALPFIEDLLIIDGAISSK